MNTEILIPKMCVIGVGLIGGSLALAMKEAGLVGEVVGVGRGEENLKAALRLGVVDSYTTDPSVGVKDADLIFGDSGSRFSGAGQNHSRKSQAGGDCD